MSSLNLKMLFDENLRDYPESPRDVEQHISNLQVKLRRQNSLKEQAAIKGELGFYLRIMGQLDASRNMLEQALEWSESHPCSTYKLFQWNIRLAHTCQWQKDFKTSHRIMQKVDRLVNRSNVLDAHRHYLKQHWGKVYFDERHYDSAILCFKEALKQRQTLGNEVLIESTMIAIEAAEKRSPHT